jgi:ABC-type sugar transport system ATPase subunit
MGLSTGGDLVSPVTAARGADADQPGSAAESILVVRGVTKRYPGVDALKSVDFDVRSGEVHALLGGNGAGKSTLARVIGGVESFDEGDVLFEGESIAGLGPRKVADLGVAVIHQRLQLFPPLTVTENIAWLVRNYPTSGGLVSGRAARVQATRILEVLGSRKISPDAKVAELRPAESWLLTIAAALSRNPKLLILDESTAALPEADAQDLFNFVRERRDAGLAVILVTHRLEEIRQIADRVTVLSDGRNTGHADGQRSTSELVSLMFGAELAAQLHDTGKKEGKATGAPLVELDGVTTRRLRDLSLTIRRGEVLGIAGALGSGRSELVRVLMGDAAIESGKVVFNGREHAPGGPRDVVGRGITVVAEGRDSTGVLHGLSLERNITVSGLRRVRRGASMILDRKRERGLASDTIDSLSIKGTRKQAIDTLSGGNQQKALIGRALLLEDDLLILDEPSAGVDVATRLELRTVLRRLAADGRAVLVISSEFDDLVRDSTRIAVLRGGKIVEHDAPFDSARLAQLAYAGGPTAK